MSGTRRKRRMGRSIGAVLVGLVAVVIVSLATDVVLHATGIYPPWGQPVASGPLLLATAYRTGYGVAGSYITARLAPGRPMQHAFAGGAIGMALSIAGAVATWNAGPAFGPHWYPVVLILLALPCSWVGGRLRVLELRASPAPSGASCSQVAGYENEGITDEE